MTTATTAQPGVRWLSIDIYRGLAVAGMLLVDYQGNEEAAYAPLMHAKWNGWTPADLIFPSFLFLAGVSVALSIAARRSRGDSDRQVLGHAARRTAILLGLALLLNGLPDFDLGSWRILGVLQRIAVCTFAATAAGLRTRPRTQLLIAAACLVGYWIWLRWIPVPGFGRPGRDVPFLDPQGNWVAWLDRHLFPGRLYDKMRDPEGVLSTVPAIGTALLGLVTGGWLRSGRATGATPSARLALVGVGGIAAGSIWGLWFPINKNLWTSSFVVLAAGFACLILALLHELVDVRGRGGRWTMPFVVLGKNPLLGFVLDGTVFAVLHWGHVRGADGQTVAWSVAANRWLLARPLTPAAASLLYALAILGGCWLLLYGLYRRRIFLKI